MDNKKFKNWVLSVLMSILVTMLIVLFGILITALPLLVASLAIIAILAWFIKTEFFNKDD